VWHKGREFSSVYLAVQKHINEGLVLPPLWQNGSGNFEPGKGFTQKKCANYDRWNEANFVPAELTSLLTSALNN